MNFSYVFKFVDIYNFSNSLIVFFWFLYSIHSNVWIFSISWTFLTFMNSFQLFPICCEFFHITKFFKTFFFCNQFFSECMTISQSRELFQILWNVFQNLIFSNAWTISSNSMNFLIVWTFFTCVNDFGIYELYSTTIFFFKFGLFSILQVVSKCFFLNS